MKLPLKLASRLVLPGIAAGLIVFAIATLSRPETVVAAPPAAPATPGPKQGSVVAALGVIEPSSRTVAVATELSGVVREVFVQPGQVVERGDPLFRLDAREVAAQRTTADADVIAAQARRASSVAALKSAEASVNDARAKLSLFDQVSDPRAVSVDEKDRAKFALQRASAQRDEAAAAIAQSDAALRQAQAGINETNTRAERLTVRAPISGTILAVDVRVGEFASAGPLTTPLISLGQLSPLHVRVQIDEEDVWRIADGAPAQGSLRGDATTRVPLTFVRFEPLATPKVNLNSGAERVDTRVVEAIYALDPATLRAFVGQQMDVFINAKALTFTPPPAAKSAEEKAR